MAPVISGEGPFVHCSLTHLLVMLASFSPLPFQE